MKNALATEFMKLRRSRVLLLAVIASALPPAVKCMRCALGEQDVAPDWTGFLASGQELAVFAMLITVILISAHIFTMEYKHGTASSIFRSATSRAAIFIAKIIVLGSVILSLLVISALSQLLFGALIIKGALPGELSGKLLSVTAWYAFSYIALGAVVALPAVLIKRFVPTAIITLGYYIMIFPFHAKNLYVCPFMTPVIMASKLYGSANYIFEFDYGNFTIDIFSAAAFLAGLAVVSFAAGIYAYKKSDVAR